MEVSGDAREVFSKRERTVGRTEAGERQSPGGPAKEVATQGPGTRVERHPSGVFTEDPEGPEGGVGMTGE